MPRTRRVAENGVSVSAEIGAKAAAAAVRSHLETSRTSAGLSLLFAMGERPAAADVERLLTAGLPDGPRARIGHRPDAGEGWLELVASGLTFDLTGLVPADAAELPPMDYRFGVPGDLPTAGLEAVRLLPGGHLAGAGGMLPVTRTMLGLAVGFAHRLPVQAVGWHPAASWMEPEYFARTVGDWLAGGAFPALGLTALRSGAQGDLESVGLGFFVGQEVRIAPLDGEPRSETGKLAIRIIDHIVREGPLTAASELIHASGAPLIAEPSDDGRIVRVRRGKA